MYRIRDQRRSDNRIPVTSLLEKAKPVFTKLPGWKCDIRGIKKYEELPENCRKYIEFIEGQIGYPITMVSNGPGRDDIIYRESSEQVIETSNRACKKQRIESDTVCCF